MYSGADSPKARPRDAGRDRLTELEDGPWTQQPEQPCDRCGNGTSPEGGTTITVSSPDRVCDLLICPDCRNKLDQTLERRGPLPYMREIYQTLRRKTDEVSRPLRTLMEPQARGEPRPHLWETMKYDAGNPVPGETTESLIEKGILAPSRLLRADPTSEDRQDARPGETCRAADQRRESSSRC